MKKWLAELEDVLMSRFCIGLDDIDLEHAQNFQRTGRYDPVDYANFLAAKFGLLE